MSAYYNRILKLQQNNQDRYSLFKYLISSKLKHVISIKKNCAYMFFKLFNNSMN